MNPMLGLVEGFREIWDHKFRSFLTMSGIILGVASLMAMFSMTEGMAAGSRKILLIWGGVANVEIVDSAVPEEQEGIADISPGRTYKDVEAIRRSAPLIQKVSPELKINSNVSFTYEGNRVLRGWVRGVERDFLDVENHKVGQGRFFTDLDQEQKKRVIVLGQEICRELFRGHPGDPIGRTIKADGHAFTVVGVFETYNDFGKDRVIVMPFKTVQDLWFGTTMANGIDQGPNLKLNRLVVQLRDTDRFDESVEQVRNVLNQTHRGISDYGFNTREDWYEAIERNIQGIRLSGGLVVIVTLLSGGVGITNIMLASIKERTREIGIRRAVGASGVDIFLQITLEAVVLALLAGLFGLVAGYGLYELLKHAALDEQQPILVPAAVAYSFCAAVITGFCSGLLPAWRASRLHPIEALRFE